MHIGQSDEGLIDKKFRSNQYTSSLSFYMLELKFSTYTTNEHVTLEKFRVDKCLWIFLAELINSIRRNLSRTFITLFKEKNRFIVWNANKID